MDPLSFVSIAAEGAATAVPTGPAAAAGVAGTITAAVTAFSATNLDDILLLLLFFSRLDRHFRVVHVVVGQSLGFGLLVAASLVGFLGHSLLPMSWIGLLGLLPISLGVSQLMELLEPDPGAGMPAPPEALAAASGLPRLEAGRWIGNGTLSRTVGVAAVTVANGSDNIGVYLPMFAHASGGQLLLTLSVFAAMLALWCWIAWRLVQAPGLAPLLEQWGGPLIPFVLIGLGGLILVDSHTLDHRGLAVLALGCVGVMVFSLVRQLSLLLDARPAATPAAAKGTAVASPVPLLRSLVAPRP